MSWYVLIALSISSLAFVIGGAILNRWALWDVPSYGGVPTRFIGNISPGVEYRRRLIRTNRAVRDVLRAYYPYWPDLQNFRLEVHPGGTTLQRPMSFGDTACGSFRVEPWLPFTPRQWVVSITLDDFVEVAISHEVLGHVTPTRLGLASLYQRTGLTSEYETHSKAGEYFSPQFRDMEIEAQTNAMRGIDGYYE